MNFPLAAWCDGNGALSDAEKARRASAELYWSVTSLHAPEPIAIDLRGVVSVSDAFVTDFFVPLVEQPPEPSVGRCPVVAFGATPQLATSLRSALSTHGAGLPIAQHG